MGLMLKPPLGAWSVLVGVCMVAPLLGGCQTVQAPPIRLINHRAMLDFSGLRSPQTFQPVKAEGAIPITWEQLKIKRAALFTDMQWRSPSRNTAVGVAYIRMPLPFGPRTLLWLARAEYVKRSDDGRMINEWIDDLGRQWFEAENSNYHVRGMILTRGFDAWIMYCGFKTAEPLDATELALGERALETFLPAPGDREPERAPVAANTAPSQ